jgi:hypothetical protein
MKECVTLMRRISTKVAMLGSMPQDTLSHEETSNWLWLCLGAQDAITQKMSSVCARGHMTDSFKRGAWRIKGFTWETTSHMHNCVNVTRMRPHARKWPHKNVMRPRTTSRENSSRLQDLCNVIWTSMYSNKKQENVRTSGNIM